MIRLEPLFFRCCKCFSYYTFMGSKHETKATRSQI